MLCTGHREERVHIAGGHVAGCGVMLAPDRAKSAPVRRGLLRDEVDTDVGAVSQRGALGPLRPHPDMLETLRAVLVGMGFESTAHQPPEPASRTGRPVRFAARRVGSEAAVALEQLGCGCRSVAFTCGGSGHGWAREGCRDACQTSLSAAATDIMAHRNRSPGLSDGVETRYAKRCWLPTALWEPCPFFNSSTHVAALLDVRVWMLANSTPDEGRRGRADDQGPLIGCGKLVAVPEDALTAQRDTPQQSSPADRDRLGRYSKRVEPAILVLAVASVPFFLLEDRFWLAAAAGWAVVAVFFVDLVVRVVLTDGSRREYLVRHWYDVAIVVLSVLPVARPLRALRAVGLLRGVRVFVAAHKMSVLLSRGWQGLHGKSLIVSSVVLSVVALVTVREAENAAGSGIDSWEAVLWWAAATVTTVGYGDLSPVTTSARVAAGVLMVCGVSLFGLLTANLSARFLQKDALLAYDQMAAMIEARGTCPNCGHGGVSAADVAADGGVS